MDQLLDDVKLAAQQAQTGITRCAWADGDRLLAYGNQQLPDEMRALLLPKLRVPEVLAISNRLARADELGELREKLNQFESETVELAVRFLNCARLFGDL
jgi:hypothetical protein